MRSPVTLTHTMKPYLPAGCLLLVALPSLGLARGERADPQPNRTAALSVLPVSVEASQVRSAESLRESLRQSFDDTDSKPHRLSSQERQRMREQLRSHSVHETTRK